MIFIANNTVGRSLRAFGCAFATCQTQVPGGIATKSTKPASETTENPKTVRYTKWINGQLRNNFLLTVTVSSRRYRLVALACLIERCFCCKSWQTHIIHFTLPIHHKFSKQSTMRFRLHVARWPVRSKTTTITVIFTIRWIVIESCHAIRKAVRSPSVAEWAWRGAVGMTTCSLDLCMHI